MTTLRSDGAPVGMTVSSFTSVSLEPPLVLICIHEHCPVLKDVMRLGQFGLNILASHQEELSLRFAAHLTDRFEGIEWRGGSSGVPLFTDVLATMECAVEQSYPCGDHWILIGRVSALDSHEGTPLVRFSRSYHSLTAL